MGKQDGGEHQHYLPISSYLLYEPHQDALNNKHLVNSQRSVSSPASLQFSLKQPQQSATERKN